MQAHEQAQKGNKVDLHMSRSIMRCIFQNYNGAHLTNFQLFLCTFYLLVDHPSFSCNTLF